MTTLLSSLRKKLHLSLALLLFVISSPLSASASSPQPTLADPPRAPQRTAATPVAQARLSPAVEPQTSACASGSQCIYLPIISQSSRQATVNLYKTAYLGSQGVSPQWTGDIAPCNPGTTSQAFRDSVTTRINYFREMAGVPKITALIDEYNQEDQAAALMMAANRQLNHTPPSTWTCYTSLGYQGSSSSNLAMGAYGAEAVSLYMDDSGVGSLGHRRWVLYPQTQQMGTGDIAGSDGWQTVTNALKVFDSHIWEARPATRDEFVAWPPAGYVPYQVVYPIWSFSVAGADFTSASVTLTSNGMNIPISVSLPDNGYGENTLAWTACDCYDWPNPGDDQTYQVTVSHVFINGAYRDYTYSVIIIDPSR